MIKWYVGFFKTKDQSKVFATAIREIEGIDFNHVEIMRCDTDKNETICFGSVSPLSRSIPLNQLEKTHELKKAIQIPVELNDYADFILAGLMGKPYSQLQILLILLKLKIKTWANWLPFVKLNLTNSLICTELVGEFLIDACGFKFAVSQEALSIKDILAIVEKGK